MKKFLILTLLVLPTFTFCQNSYDLQMKNDLIYYQFEHKFENSTKCISKYFDPKKGILYYQKLYDKTMNFNTNKMSSLNYKGYQILTGVDYFFRGNCNDTLDWTFELKLPEKYKLFGPYYGKHIAQHSIKARLELVFLGKSEYILKIKGFTYNTSIYDGSKNYPLTEVYQEFLKNYVQSKKEADFFSDLNNIFLRVDGIFNEVITELIQADN